MEIITGVGIAIGGIALVILLRSLTTLFHEMGHALPALLFTTQKVEVFVGSYGDLKGSVQLSLGRLKLYLRWNPFDWKLGMCRHAGEMNLGQQVITILGGPLASTLIAVAAILILTKNGVSDFWLGLAAIFAGAALIDLLVNLGLGGQELQMYDGAVTYADGEQLRRILRVISLPELYFAAFDEFEQGAYATALEKCQTLREKGHHQQPIYELCWQILEKTGDDASIITLYQDFKAHHKLKFPDYFRLAQTFRRLGNVQEASKYYDHCSYLDYTNPQPRFEKGKILLEQGYYGPALEELTLSNNLRADHQETLALLGACYMRFNDQQKCQQVLARARALDSEQKNATVNYFWGLWQEKLGNYEAAFAALQRAQQLGFQHHGLPMLLTDLEREIEKEAEH